MADFPMVRNETVFTGATFRREYRWTADGEPVDLTGWSAVMVFGPYTDGREPYITLTTDDDGITLGPTGTIVVTVTDEATAEMGYRHGRYRLELEQPGGDVIRFLEGEVTFQ